MAGLRPGHPRLRGIYRSQDVDARDKRGHDEPLVVAVGIRVKTPTSAGGELPPDVIDRLGIGQG
ncbi:MAG: hypothetical protein ACREDL_00155, partial [Bradyrhizobium sp.]